jgi:hypothetical protein
MKKPIMHDGVPAINVKVYNGFPAIADVIARFPGTSPADAEKALEHAWECAQGDFWSYWTDPANIRKYFPTQCCMLNLRVEIGGRSNGWLELHGIPDFIDKDDNLPVEWPVWLLKRWAKFATAVEADVKYRCSVDYVLDIITVNEWVKPLASQYNFIDLDTGDRCCLADMRGAIVRFVKNTYGDKAAQYITDVLAREN